MSIRLVDNDCLERIDEHGYKYDILGSPQNLEVFKGKRQNITHNHCMWFRYQYWLTGLVAVWITLKAIIWMPEGRKIIGSCVIPDT